MTSRVFEAINADQLVTATDRLLIPTRRWREPRPVPELWLCAHTMAPSRRAFARLPLACVAGLGAAVLAALVIGFAG